MVEAFLFVICVIYLNYFYYALDGSVDRVFLKHEILL